MDTPGIQDPQVNILTITEVTGKIKDVLETNPELADVWVRGEISNFTHHSSGHMYFSLKDKGAQIRAVMFSRYVSAMKAPVSAGVEVVAYGSISVYEKRGEYQLYVKYMQPAGVGALYLEFEKLKNRLGEEGLFDESRKKAIPRFPKRVAVVTSATGAAVRDVINIITRRYPAIEVTVVPATVQGDGAPKSIRAALARAAKLRDVDTILLVRGGGSIEDLWGFNDEGLARDIAACDVPIISGVGHETDFTIADFVSDLRAPTPSAAAEIAVPDLAALLSKLDRAAGVLRRNTGDIMRYYSSKLETAAATLSGPRLLEQIDRRRQLIDDLLDSSDRRLRYRIESGRDKLEHLEKRLTSLDPRNVMARGFAVCADAVTGKVITSVKSVKHGRLINVTLGDGEFPARADLKLNSNQGALEFDE